ncbi:hypothetical protein J3R30DRAFT_2674781 [Lentinula aciculospora]|uniref:Uncharacterized protein n=1 Tax=Lentinula aciculospora TaxID=153920 RepID=A0A9W8ZS32_9AGAR|nr:hypothetical protein J3R30DRAFT_2674781 [Lentinula aciculospora]
MIKLTLLSALTASLSAVHAQDVLGLSYNSTSPYGQSKGILALTAGNYGYAMSTASGTTPTLSATYDNTTQTLTQVCPYPGLIAAMIPVSGSSPAAYAIEWVNNTVTLPENSTTTSLYAANEGLDTTLGTKETVWYINGVFKVITLNGVSEFGWVDEDYSKNGDVTSWIDTTDGSSITC